ncbi:MAG: preprotein translocase subunit YajC [Christensenellales bacterium]|jgi:preprotein translocase subunit YajC
MPNDLGAQIMQWGVPIILFAVLIFAMIIPQRRKDKKIKEMLNSIKKGDKIRTIGGMYGRVASIDEQTVVLEVGPDKIKMPFVRSAIATVDSSPDEIEAPTMDKVD